MYKTEICRRGNQVRMCIKTCMRMNQQRSREISNRPGITGHRHRDQCRRHRIPTFGISVRFWNILVPTGVTLIRILDCSWHQHFNSFRYRTDWMPYSPAFRHLKNIERRWRRIHPARLYCLRWRWLQPARLHCWWCRLNTPCTSTLLMV